MLLASRQYRIEDYLAMLRRRWYLLLLPAIIIPVLTYVGSIFIPNRYTSQTLVLVERPRVPDAYVKSAAGDELGERLSTMQEQILSRTRLQPIIDQFGLYHNEVGKVPMEALIDRMRKNILVKPVRAEFAQSAGLPGFYISFTNDDAHIAQLVCAQITSMFMDANLKAREQRAQGTTDFLRSQLTDAKKQLDDQDARLAGFQEKYLNQLPGSEQTNLSMLGSLNTRLEAATQAVTQAQQQKTYLEAMLAQQEAAYRQSMAMPSGSAQSSDELLKRRETLYSELQGLEAQDTPDHPDVIKVKNSIAKLDAQIARSRTAQADPHPTQNKDMAEPKEIQQLRLNAQMAGDAVKAQTSQRDQIQSDIRKYEARVQLSPKVEQEYKQLTRDYQSAQAFYDDLLKKSQQSEMSTDLERKQEGEQFRVMDPANLPERPTFPNRPLLAGGGFVLGLAIGIGLVLLYEYRDQSLRSEIDVLAALKLKTLAMLPDINEPVRTASWRERRRLKRAVTPVTTV